MEGNRHEELTQEKLERIFETIIGEDETIYQPAIKAMLDYDVYELVEKTLLNYQYASNSEISEVATGLYYRINEILLILKKKVREGPIGFRITAIKILGNYNDYSEELVPLFLELIKDDNKNIRYEAGKAMVKINESTSVPLLVKKIKKAKDWRVRDAAIKTLENVCKGYKYDNLGDFLNMVEKKYMIKKSVWERYKGEILVGIITGSIGLLGTLLGILL